MTADFSEHPLPLIFILSLIVVFASAELGRRLGVRGRGSDEGIATLEAATLGLLALMIGFTFSMSIARHEARRDAVLNEANAIATTGLRARLLPAPHNKEILDLLRQYVRLRIDSVQRPLTAAETSDVVVRSNKIHEALWQHVKVLADKDKGLVPTGLFIQSLNEMIDNQEKRLISALNHLPNFVLLILYGIAATAIAFAGYNRALRGSGRIPIYTVGLLLCIVILMIHDLDRPIAGFITVNQQPIFDAAATLASFQE